MKDYNEIAKRLSEEDRKVIEREKRIAYIFSTIIFLLGILFNICFVLVRSDGSQSLEFLLPIDIGVLLICFLIIFFMNRRHNADLREMTKIARIKQVIMKYQEISHEAGSGVLYIPILGDLFPKLWGQKMRPIQVCYLNIDNYRYRVEKELYDIVEDGDLVEMHYAKNSSLLLTICKFESANFSSALPD